MNETVILGACSTPAGEYRAVFTARGLGRLGFPAGGQDECAAWARRWAPQAEVRPDGPLLEDLAAQLTAYFEGRLRVFDLPLDLRGTPFQLQVWREVLAIGYGETRAYGAVAAAIGKPRAFRAVGAANGANPIPIIVPCHRLIGSNGTLIKYGGGRATKRRLLELEGVRL